MNTTSTTPQTLLEAIKHFSDLDVCHKFMADIRWPDGKVQCPRCQCGRIGFIATRRNWQCKGCKKQFSVKLGTIFEDSPLGLDKWLPAVWMAANCKNGISSYELARDLGVTQKTAWFMLHRIRLAMQTGSFQLLKGTVEADETFIGGKARNMHYGKRKAKGRGAVGKAVVMGLLERHGEVRAKVIPNTRKSTVQHEVRTQVYHGSEVFTDALPSYKGLNDKFVHEAVDHAECYVNGKVHTNGLENFWSLLKRMIHGTYVSIAPFHLFRYLDEETFRFNNRKGNDADRFVKTLGSVIGRRLTWNKTIGKEPCHA